jgi:hypothetical protein
MENLFRYVREGSITGIHPDITTSSLNNFRGKWGSTPDAFQLANPSRQGNRKGYMADEEPIDRCGAYVEMDFMECDFNQPVPQVTVEGEYNGLRKKAKVKKLPTYGGAIAACVSVDARTGYIIGQLVKSIAAPLDLVQYCVNEFEGHGHSIRKFAADSGVLSQSQYQVFVPVVERYLTVDKHIEIVQSEPYNHSNGSPHVKGAIKIIKARICMAVQCSIYYAIQTSDC